MIRYQYGVHGTIEQEWDLHKKCSEWWYTTGTLYSRTGDMFAFQYTLVKNRVFGIQMWLAMEALTDLQTGKHYYNQTFLKGKNKPMITPDSVFANGSTLTKDDQGFDLHLVAKDYAVKVRMDAKKPPVWHCEDGFLRMGVLNQDRESTLYYSYTNLQLEGVLTLEGKEIAVTGQGWFDKQGGPFHVTSLKTHWEWFSLRFFDGEEMMLFSFPQDNYRDGTYILEDGTYRRLQDYSIEPLEFTVANDIKFSCKWRVKLPGYKEEDYHIVPLAEGQINLAYFELLAGVYNQDGKLCGYCFVELLPGVYNKKIPIALTKTV